VDRCLVRRVTVPAAVALCLASVVGWTGVSVAAGAATGREAQGDSSLAGAVSGPAVLLINGDRVISSGRAASRKVAVAPASAQGLAGATMSLSLGGHHYVVPTAAVPYLGHGLDWMLFDVSALATAEKAGRLPVRISYGARLRALPGVTITRSGGGLASGYLTISSARVFGAALIRQFRADRRSGSYGRDGMFAGGESVALAGSTAAAAARPDLPMHVLTMTATNISGKPDNGDVVFVVNEDNSTLFGDPIEAENDFYKGSTKFSVPAGNYWALGMFFDASGATRLVVLPHFSVPSTGSASVPMAESLASSRITFATSLPARVTDVQATLLTQSAAGPESSFSFDNADFPLYLSPTTSAPPVGHLYLGVNALLHSPSTAASPYQYNLVYQDASGTIPAQDYTVQASGLATLHQRFFQAGRAQGGFFQLGIYPWEGGYFTTIYPQALPYQRTVYATGDPAAQWAAESFQSYATLAGGQSASLEQYAAGQTVPDDWNAGPLHAGTNMNLIGAANLFTAIPSASRSGNTLALDVTPFSDSQPGHLGSGFEPGIFGATGKVTGSYEIDQNGKKIAGGNAVKAAQGGTALYAQARLSAKPSVIKFVVSASRTGRAYGLAASSRTVWTWPSARQAGAVLPAGWICPASQACVVQPMMTLEYSVPGLRLNESARPGQQVLDFSAAQLQLATAATVKTATVQVSQDGGKTWRPVAVTGTGPGRFRAVFSDKQAGAVALRASAADSAGSQIKETILSAYKVS
jgi:hypothetical protein